MKLTKTDLQLHRPVAGHVILVLFIAAIGFALPGRAFATGDFTVTVTASANPTTIYTGQSATGSASASIMGNNAGAQQEIIQYNPSASFSVSVKGTHANDTPPSASINSANGSDLIVTAGSGTTADAYTVTVTATYSWTETGNVPYSASGTASFGVTVVAITASFTSQPPGRLPISGSTDNSKSINITISPSPLPENAPTVRVAIVCTSANGAASVYPGTLDESGSVTLKGTANSDTSNNLTIQVMIGGVVLASSNAFTVSTWPTALKLGILSIHDNFGLTVSLNWTSESGNVGDLGNCFEMEAGTYGYVPNPPFANQNLQTQTAPLLIPNTSKDILDYPQGSVNCATGAQGDWIIYHQYNWWDKVLGNSSNAASILNDTRTWSIRPLANHADTSTGYTFQTTVVGTGISLPPCIENGYTQPNASKSQLPALKR